MISVIMPVYNSELYLRDAIESILNQSFKKFELIIIDDCSNDNSLSILESFNDRRINLIKKNENIGYTSLLNESIKYSNYGFIARMDSDDISHEDRLSKQFEFLSNNSEYSVVGSNIKLINEKSLVIRNSKYPETDIEIKNKLKNFSTFAHPSCLIRKKNLIDVGGYREIFEPSEDYDLWTRLATHTKMHNLQDYLLSYRVHSKSVSSLRGIDQQIKTFFIQKNYDLIRKGHQDLIELNKLKKIDLEVCKDLFKDIHELNFLIYYHNLKININNKSYLRPLFIIIFLVIFYPKMFFLKLKYLIKKI